eukprot:1145741-Pelagomonas_calceolata.AAC.3
MQFAHSLLPGAQHQSRSQTLSLDSILGAKHSSLSIFCLPSLIDVVIVSFAYVVFLFFSSLRHLQQAARKLKPGQSSRLHTAFINFKQTHDTIPMQALWHHLQRTRMPNPLLKIIQNMYDFDGYIQKDGEKAAWVHPNTDAKQGCPLSPLLFSLYVNDRNDLAEGVQGAATGTDGVHVTHMLYADDLTLIAHDPSALQTMLDRLDVHAWKKYLIINIAKSEVVHFNSSGPNLPVFSVGGVPLAHKESFKDLGMLFNKHISMAKSSGHITGSFMASAYQIRQFVGKHALRDRPHVTLWLGKHI